MLFFFKFLKNVIGYCLDDGKVEVIVFGRFGLYSLDYEIIFLRVESDLNFSVVFLRDVLKVGNEEIIDEVFYFLKIDYFKLKFVKEYR